ncbi:hypothetical protein [Thiocystis minor]|uniref:hypothetical protein n=1 Tax=Thiocystis minor TaxID=61597 RepID=UPI001914CA4E|nr:hypothetical protein [Thiocystis minor]
MIKERAAQRLDVLSAGEGELVGVETGLNSKVLHRSRDRLRRVVPGPGLVGQFSARVRRQFDLRLPLHFCLPGSPRLDGEESRRRANTGRKNKTERSKHDNLLIA